VIRPSAAVKSLRNQEQQAKAKYFDLRKQLAIRKSPKIVERRLAPDGKHEIVVTERTVMHPDDQPRVVREAQERLITSTPTRGDAQTATANQLRRQISETQRRLKEWNEKCERQVRESQQQLADAEKKSRKPTHLIVSTLKK